MIMMNLCRLKNSDAKQQLFSGRDSLLREVISHTPRTFEEVKEDTTNPAEYLKHDESKENNSDAATKKRVNLSNLVGSVTPSSSNSSQFFQNNSSFQRFSINQFNNMIENKDFGVLLQLREKAIRYREKTEKKLITKMIESQKYSPRTINSRKQQLETWVYKEKEEIKLTKDRIIEKWNQTRRILEQTEQNAKIIKQQIASLDCSRKASYNFASPISDQDLESIGLESYREDMDKGSKSIDEDEETKAIHYSEPQRLMHSESENFCGNHTNSVISLRISVLSNKSEEIDYPKKPIEQKRLERTRNVGKLDKLIPSYVMDHRRKNQSETFEVGSVFKKLLDADEGTPKYSPFNLQGTYNKIFEYRPYNEQI